MATENTATRTRVGGGGDGAGGPDLSALSAEKPDTLLRYYRLMLLIRRFEERTGEMYTRAKIGGYCHLNLGEEATIVGLMEALEPKDYLFTNYREHGYTIARGIEPGRVRLLGGYAIVGGQVPLATGAALAISYRGTDEIVMCQLGDGTTNIGAFHESVNLASLWNLPIVYAVVNNLTGMGTPVEASSAEPELYKRAAAYRVHGERVDGNDVLAVRDAARAAVQRAREQQRPQLLEAVSFRQRGHSVVDPARYRPKEQVELGRAQDPLARLRRQLLDAALLDEAGAMEIEAEVDREVAAAIEFADESPLPAPEELFDRVYATPVANEPAYYPGESPFKVKHP